MPAAPQVPVVFNVDSVQLVVQCRKLYWNYDELFVSQIESFVEHLSPPVVNEKIFPNIVSGFMDSNPVVREHTIKVCRCVLIFIAINYTTATAPATAAADTIAVLQ